MKDISVCIDPTKYRLKLRSSSRGKLKRLVKSEFMGKTFFFDSASERLKFIFAMFTRLKPLDPYEAKCVSRFLRSQKLSRAETHAVLFNLGFRFKWTSPAYDKQMRHLDINGYVKYRKVGRQPKAKNNEAEDN